MAQSSPKAFSFEGEACAATSVATDGQTPHSRGVGAELLQEFVEIAVAPLGIGGQQNRTTDQEGHAEVSLFSIATFEVFQQAGLAPPVFWFSTPQWFRASRPHSAAVCSSGHCEKIRTAVFHEDVAASCFLAVPLSAMWHVKPQMRGSWKPVSHWSMMRAAGGQVIQLLSSWETPEEIAGPTARFFVRVPAEATCLGRKTPHRCMLHAATACSNARRHFQR